MSGRRRAPYARGQVVEVAQPFVLGARRTDDGDDAADPRAWKPGVRVVRDPADPTAAEGRADGVGTMLLAVVDVLVPKGEVAHVFYRRSYVAPDGRAFGNGKLLVDAIKAFGRVAAGHPHPYVVDGTNRDADA